MKIAIRLVIPALVLIIVTYFFYLKNKEMDSNSSLEKPTSIENVKKIQNSESIDEVNFVNNIEKIKTPALEKNKIITKGESEVIQNSNSFDQVEKYYVESEMGKYIESNTVNFISFLSDHKKELILAKYSLSNHEGSDAHSDEELTKLLVNTYVKNFKEKLKNRLSNKELTQLLNLKKDKIWKKVEIVELSLMNSTEEKKKFNEYLNNTKKSNNEFRINIAKKYTKMTDMAKYMEHMALVTGYDLKETPKEFFEHYALGYFLYITSVLNEDEFITYSNAIFANPSIVEISILNKEFIKITEAAIEN